jgi:predicted Zn-ribbon and HTH transcriptional regulator
MPTKVTIYAADGEMRREDTGQYDPGAVAVQLHTMSWLINRLRTDGHAAQVVLDTGETETSIEGLSEQESAALYEAMQAAGEDVGKTIILQEVANELMPGLMVCQRCGNIWYRRGLELPLKCPGCGSNRWTTRRTGKEPGRKPKERERVR